MKILKIYCKNHALFKNLEFDFSKNATEGYDTIILTGENGTGKTTLFRELDFFLKGKGLSFDAIDYLNDSNKDLHLVTIDKSKTYGFHDILSDGSKIHVHSNENNNPNDMKKNDLDIRSDGAIYSSSQMEFKTKKITSITSSEIGHTVATDDFTSIKQLLIDLEAQDNETFKSLNMDGNSISYDDFLKSHSKVFAFSNAFNSFFDHLKYKGMKTVDGAQAVLFEKDGETIYIDNLSSGEKQIVFRGTYLLNGLKNCKGGFVFIDEPEISLHPLWEDKILNYYRQLLFSSSVKIGQLFVATHSDRILESAIGNRGILICGLKYENGNIEMAKFDSPCALPYRSNAEIMFKIFGVASHDLHIQLFNQIQDANHLNSIHDVDGFIERHSLFDRSKHYVVSGNPHSPSTAYHTVCVKIRNQLHHGDPSTISKTELEESIRLMYRICGGTC